MEFCNNILPLPQKRTNNFKLYLLVSSISYGVFRILLEKIFFFIDQKSFLFKTTFIWCLLFSRIPFAISYLLTRCRENLTSLQMQTKIKYRHLIIPTILKIIIYISIISSQKYINTMFCGVILIINLIFSEIGNHYLLFLKRSKLTVQKSKIIALILFIVSILISTVQSDQSDYNLVISLGLLILISITIQGFFYLHKKILQMYKAETNQLIAKQLILEISLFPIAIFIFISLNCFLNYGCISRDVVALFEQLKMFNEFKNQIVWLILLFLMFPLQEYIFFSYLKQNTWSQLYFLYESYLVWYNFIFLIKNTFSVKVFLAEIIYILSIIIYFKLVKMKHLYNFVFFMIKKQKNTNPIPLK